MPTPGNPTAQSTEQTTEFRLLLSQASDRFAKCGAGISPNRPQILHHSNLITLVPFEEDLLTNSRSSRGHAPGLHVDRLASP